MDCEENMQKADLEKSRTIFPLEISETYLHKHYSSHIPTHIQIETASNIEGKNN